MSLHSLTARGVSEADAMRVLMAVNHAAQRTHVPADAILSRARDQRTAHARALAMYEASRLHISLAAIGRAMGRDHTTVISAVRGMEARRAE